MPVVVTAVSFGPSAVNRLRALVDDAKAGDPLAPVTVVVADNFSGVATRRALAARAGVAAVGFVTMHRLAEQLGGPRLAAEGRRPASPPVIAAAVRSVLGDDPGVFTPVRDHAATEEALVEAYRELASVSPEGLQALRACSRRAADVCRFVRDARDRLRSSWFDEADLLAAAAQASAGAIRAFGPVIVHLPRDVRLPEASLLRALAEATPVTVLLGVTGDEHADRLAREAAARLGERAVTVPATGQVAHATRIVSVSDPDEEVRAAARELLAAARDGVALGRTAILYGVSEPYARLVHEHLEAAGIPHNGAAVRTIGDALLGRTLRGLLALPDHEFRRREVLGVLACNHVVGADGHRVPSRAWERISRAAGVVDGDDWEARLVAYAAFAREEADGYAADGDDRRASASRKEAEFTDSLRAFVADLRVQLARGAAISTWEGNVSWASALLARYLGDERRRVGWPDEERQAATRVEEVLERLRGLDAVGGREPGLDVFRRALDAELRASLRRVGRFGDGVFVSHVRAAPGLTFDHVVVLGLAEGAFPSRRQEDSLLPDRERETTGGELQLRVDHVHDDHRALLAVLAGSAASTLTYPRGDLRRRGERSASRWLLASARALVKSEVELFTDDLAALRGEAWFDEVASYTAGTAACDFPATLDEYDVGTLLRDGIASQHAAESPIVSADPVTASGVELVLARASARFTRFDGNLSGPGAHVRSPVDGYPVSPTRLEAWAKCPHAYLFERVLGVEIATDPERTYEMTALDKGNLVHKVLEDFVAAAVEAPDGDDRVAALHWDDGARQRLRALAERECDSYEARGLTGRPVFWRRDRARILREIDDFLGQDERRRGERGVDVRPVAAELEFGTGRGRAPVEFVLSDGRAVRLRGKVDRVDRGADGALVVIDYKTGGTRAYKDVTDGDPVQRGASLQLPVYGAAARAAFGTDDTPVHAAYWFTSTKGDWDWIGYDVTDDVVGHMVAALDVIVAGIEGGVFPARPNRRPPYGYVDCHYCNPDGLGTGDRRRDWERKRADAALAAYSAFAEPEGDAA